MIEGICILVVEDDKACRELLERMLKRLTGGIVMSAENGKMALSILQSKRPNVIVSDVLMPEINGLTLKEEMKAQGIEIPTIFISAYCPDCMRERLDALGVAFFAKPVDFKQLSKKIGDCLTVSNCS